jgi:hypothetical protein
MEWKPNTNINKSISFSFIHENYKNEEDLDRDENILTSSFVEDPED